MDLLNIRRNALSGANRKRAIDAFLDADARTGPAPQSTVQQQPGSVVENARQRALMALGASPKPDMGIPQARLVTPTTATSGLRSLLPGRGTPGSAALGAFGSTMSQLGGWQDKPMTFGQILGASLGKAREAYGTAEERQRQIAEKKAALEKAEEETQYTRQRQSMLDAITVGNFNIARRKAAREEAAAGQPTKPYEIYDVQTGRKKFVRDVRTKEGGWSTEDVGGVAADKPTKEGKPSGFVSVYTKNGDFVENVREDSPEADDYANKGYRIVESTSITGTKKDVGLGARATGQIQTDIMDIEESISDLNDIQNSFDPKMQTFFTRGEAALKALLEKGGKELNEADAKLVGDVAVYKQNAWDAVNAYIKYLTGAQMSEAEARRIMKSFPDPRLGLSEGDSPTEYKRKLDGVLRKARLSLARNSYALSKGLTPTANPEADVEKNQDDVIYVDEKGRRLGIEQIPHLMRREESRLKKQFADLEESERESRVESEMRKIFSI